jgi:bifunctional non-homologous end joining protein LigD
MGGGASSMSTKRSRFGPARAVTSPRTSLTFSALRGSVGASCSTVSSSRPCAALDVEGVVAKRVDSPYRPGVRSGDWLKLKTAEWKSAHAPMRHAR